MNNTVLNPFTVIAVNRDAGQIISHHVKALNESEAFVVVSKLSDLDMVVAIEGWVKEGQGIEFPGTATVDSQTAIDQQEIFGGASVTDFYDAEYDVLPYWFDLALSELPNAKKEEVLVRAEGLYMQSGGRKAA